MIEPTIVAALSALFNGKVFPDTVPAGVARPFLIYQQIGGVPSNTFCGDTDKQNARIQFVVWAKATAAFDGRTEANTLMRAAAVILTDPPISGVSQGTLVALHDEMTRTYGARQDFSFWF
jgi:hypothetical protein